MAIVAEQDQVLAEMADRTREIQEATAQRREELRQLRAAREQREVNFQFYLCMINIMILCKGHLNFFLSIGGSIT